MSNTNINLLVCGFIREIKLLHHSIPAPIIQTCCSYCIELCKLFIYHQQQFHIVHHIDDNKPIFQSLTPLDPTNQISQLPLGSPQYCHIPNISSGYDGIIGLNPLPKARREFHPIIILFKSLNLNNTSNTNEYKLFESSKTIRVHHNHTPHQYLYCRNKQSVIYEDHCSLYQLNINNISIKDKDFSFNKIAGCPNKLFDSSSGEYEEHALSMSYIPTCQKLFAINSYFCHWAYQDIDTKNKSIAKCGIYNFKENKWIKTKPYEYYKCADQHSTIFGASKNDCFQQNNIYIVSTFGHTAQYDMNKDEWCQLTKDTDLKVYRFSNEQPKLWMDSNPNILHCAAWSNVKQNMYLYFGKFDVRTNDKWIQIQNDEFNKIINVDCLFL